MIPISLYVLIELLKLLQAKLINADLRMQWREDGQFALCRNSDLIEELGQVEFVFSDKTGTLTQNKMEFKKFHIDNEIYGNLLKNEKEQEGMPNSAIDKIKKGLESEQADKLFQFFRLMAVCHTVVIEKKEGKDP